ncbi:TPA: hypothetical protein ACGTQW_004284, partial [Escherichia coli]
HSAEQQSIQEEQIEYFSLPYPKYDDCQVECYLYKYFTDFRKQVSFITHKTMNYKVLATHSAM